MKGKTISERFEALAMETETVIINNMKDYGVDEVRIKDPIFAYEYEDGGLVEHGIVGLRLVNADGKTVLGIIATPGGVCNPLSNDEGNTYTLFGGVLSSLLTACSLAEHMDDIVRSIQFAAKKKPRKRVSGT